MLHTRVSTTKVSCKLKKRGLIVKNLRWINSTEKKSIVYSTRVRTIKVCSKAGERWASLIVLCVHLSAAEGGTLSSIWGQKYSGCDLGVIWCRARLYLAVNPPPHMLTVPLYEDRSILGCFWCKNLLQEISLPDIACLRKLTNCTLLTTLRVGDRPQGVAGDCNSLAETHAWFDSRVAHHYI